MMTFLPDTRRAFVAILVLGLFALAARSVTDPDVWWHLRTGQLILQNRAIFHADPYSFTKLGQLWMNHEWLSDVLIFSLYRGAGWFGPIVFFAAVTCATFMLVFFRCEGGPYLAAVFAVWSAIAAAPSFGVRPQTFSLFLAGLFLLILERSYIRPNLLWCLVPLMLVWVNLHAGYALGIALIFLFLLGDALDAWLVPEKIAGASGRLRKMAIICAACVAVVPINPYGTRMYWYPVQTLHSGAMQMYISEWSSPNFHQEMYLPLLLLMLAIFIAFAVSPLRLRSGELLLLLVVTWAGLHSARHVPIYAVVAAPILSKLVCGWLRERGIWFESGDKETQTGHPLLNGLALATVLLLCGLKVRHVIGGQRDIENRAFPASAVSFLQANRLPGPVLNSYNWGGYLIWRLYPGYRVFIDGRADLYGDSFLDQFASTYRISNPSWRDTLDRWQIQTVILPPDAPLTSALRLLPGWRQVYGDSQAVILRKM